MLLNILQFYIIFSYLFVSVLSVISSFKKNLELVDFAIVLLSPMSFPIIFYIIAKETYEKNKNK